MLTNLMSYYPASCPFLVQATVVDAELLTEWQARRAAFRSRNKQNAARDADALAKIATFTQRLRGAEGVTLASSRGVADAVELAGPPEKLDDAEVRERRHAHARVWYTAQQCVNAAPIAATMSKTSAMSILEKPGSQQLLLRR